MCRRCELSPEDQAVSDARVVDSADAIRGALFGSLNADGSPGEVPAFSPQTVGELADALMSFAWAIDNAQGISGLVRAVIDRGLDSLEMRASNGAGGDGLAALIGMLRSGQATVARGPLFGMNVNDGGIPTGDRAPDDATPGMHL
jgi:hypothetical protein